MLVNRVHRGRHLPIRRYKLRQFDKCKDLVFLVDLNLYIQEEFLKTQQKQSSGQILFICFSKILLIYELNYLEPKLKV